MNDIPITFSHEGKTYKGYFKAISGSGGVHSWHLMVNNYYCGTLHYTDTYGLAYHGNRFNELAQFFIDYVTLWIE